MRVFISWSGDQSKKIAESLRQWLPSVIQAIKPYYSPDDIAKGARWNAEISKELEASKIGLICLTPSNKNSAWIMFEAGALSKQVETSKVCPILFGLDPSDVDGPLTSFQLAKYSKEEMYRVVQMMNNELLEHRIDTDILKRTFEVWWPKLEEEIVKITIESPDVLTNKRPDRQILEEVLEISRDSSLLTQRMMLLLEERVTRMFDLYSNKMWEEIIRTEISEKFRYVPQKNENSTTHTKTPRILAAAKEFNIGKGKLVEFLWNKGFEVIDSPSTKLTEEMYDLLIEEFGTRRR